MLLIPCPHCGRRAEIEFQYGGEVNPRPSEPSALDDVQWTDYLYRRSNPKGPMREHWWHQHGCRQWFVLTRDTTNNRVLPERGPL